MHLLSRTDHRRRSGAARERAPDPRGAPGSPAAPEGRSFVRFTVHCAMSDAQCEHFLEVMEAARRVLGDALHAEPAEARPRAPEVQEFWGP